MKAVYCDYCGKLAVHTTAGDELLPRRWDIQIEGHSWDLCSEECRNFFIIEQVWHLKSENSYYSQPLPTA